MQPVRKNNYGTEDDDVITSVTIGRGSMSKTFTFDRVFPATTSQETLYEQQVAPLVKACIRGYHATVLAYGQTGAGKSHTILGPPSESKNGNISFDASNEQSGVIPRAISQLFEKVKSKENVLIEIQFLELYGEEIRDLLISKADAPRKLSIREGFSDPEVVGATWKPVRSADEALEILALGGSRRVVAATQMNATSSRSHCLFTVKVEQTEGTTKLSSKFHFVDLAGAERQKRTGATGTRLQEGIDINKGLLVLGNVIAALGNQKFYGVVPYRDSKLTRLLKGSLGGHHRTLMIACVSPSTANLEESLNCLRYANRAKNIRNEVVQNVDPATQRLRSLQTQMQRLAQETLRLYKGHKTLETFTVSELEELAGVDKAKAQKSPKKKTSSLQAELTKKEKHPRSSSLQTALRDNCSDSLITTEKNRRSSLQVEASKSSDSDPDTSERSTIDMTLSPTMSEDESIDPDEAVPILIVGPVRKNIPVSKPDPTTKIDSTLKDDPVGKRGSGESLSKVAESEETDTDEEDDSAVIDNLKMALFEAQTSVIDMQEREETWMLKASTYLEEINRLQNQVARNLKAEREEVTRIAAAERDSLSDASEEDVDVPIRDLDLEYGETIIEIKAPERRPQQRAGWFNRFMKSLDTERNDDFELESVTESTM